MKTIHLDATQSDAIDYAAALLRDGQMVVFPTDTVYGIGVDAWQRAAVERLYTAKQRARDKGIPILIADAVALDDLTDMSAAQRAWIDIYVATYWPGPLTLVLPRSADLPDNLTPNDGIAVRIPDNSVARRLIRAAGGAVAASSANRSGEPPIQSAENAFAIFDGIAAAILDGGYVGGGTPSTILDCTVVPPHILRDGPIPMQALRPEFEQLA